MNGPLSGGFPLPKSWDIHGTTDERSKDLTQGKYDALKAAKQKFCEKCGRPFRPPANFLAAKLCFDCKPSRPFVKHEARREGWSYAHREERETESR
jgi:hypothetical protein